MGILEKISEIEREISRTQKNKGNSCDFLQFFTILLFCFTEVKNIVNLSTIPCIFRSHGVPFGFAESKIGKVSIGIVGTSEERRKGRRI